MDRPSELMWYAVTGGAAGEPMNHDVARRFRCLTLALRLDAAVDGWRWTKWSDDGLLTIWRSRDDGQTAHALSAYVQRGDVTLGNLKRLPPSLAAVALRDALSPPPGDVPDLDTATVLCFEGTTLLSMTDTLEKHWDPFGVDSVAGMVAALQAGLVRDHVAPTLRDVMVPVVGRHLLPLTDTTVAFLTGLDASQLARVVKHASGDLGLAAGDSHQGYLRSAARVGRNLRSSDDPIAQDLAPRLEYATVQHVCSRVAASLSLDRIRALPVDIFDREPIAPGDDPSRLHMTTMFVKQLADEKKLDPEGAGELLGRAVDIVSHHRDVTAERQATDTEMQLAVGEVCSVIDIAHDLSAAAMFATRMTRGLDPGVAAALGLDATLTARGARFGRPGPILTIDPPTGGQSPMVALEAMTWAFRFMQAGQATEEEINASLRAAREALPLASFGPDWISVVRSGGAAILEALAIPQLHVVLRVVLDATALAATQRHDGTADPHGAEALLTIGRAVIDRAASPEEMLPAAYVLQWAATGPKQSAESVALFSHLSEAMRAKLTDAGWAERFVRAAGKDAPVVQDTFGDLISGGGLT